MEELALFTNQTIYPVQSVSRAIKKPPSVENFFMYDGVRTTVYAKKRSIDCQK